LVGIFAEDQSLNHLADLSCVRELRALGGGWQRIDVEQLQRCLGQAAADARRLFGDAAKALHTGARFDLAQGQIGEAIRSQSLPDDIIAVIEPKNPAERVTHQFQQLLDMALSAPAAALLVPSRISRRKGPVVAVATAEDDASIRAALKVAESSREKLLVLAPPDIDQTSLTRLAASHGVDVSRRPIRGGDIDALELASLLALTGERFMVLSRSSNTRLPSRLAFERGVPVLVTEPN
jgi:hypothetical protein